MQSHTLHCNTAKHCNAKLCKLKTQQLNSTNKLNCMLHEKFVNLHCLELEELPQQYTNVAFTIPEQAGNGKRAESALNVCFRVENKVGYLGYLDKHTICLNSTYFTIPEQKLNICFRDENCINFVNRKLPTASIKKLEANGKKLEPHFLGFSYFGSFAM
jgi:hypothetical protein